MCINKCWLWDRTQKITWFHILLARNTIFPFFAVPGHQPHLAKRRWSCLAVQALASNLHLSMFWKMAVSPIHGLVWCPINTYNSFFQFFSRCRRLLCNCHLIFLTTLFLTLEPVQESDCHPDTRIPTCKLGCLLPRKQSFCSKLFELSFHYTIQYLIHYHLMAIFNIWTQISWAKLIIF